MAKINNEQRGGLVRILADLRKALEARNEWNDPKRDSKERELRAKHGIAALEKAS